MQLRRQPALMKFWQTFASPSKRTFVAGVADLVKPHSRLSLCGLPISFKSKTVRDQGSNALSAEPSPALSRRTKRPDDIFGTEKGIIVPQVHRFAEGLGERGITRSRVVK